jgi:hypothetical protein
LERRYCLKFVIFAILFKFLRKEGSMRSTAFRKPVAFFVALVFVFTSVLVSPVFAEFTSVGFKDAGPVYAEGDNYSTALKPLNMQVTVSGTTTAQALTLSLTGTNADKFYLSEDTTATTAAISTLTVNITTWSALTFDVTAYIGVTSGPALSANDTVTITAKDANSAREAFVTIKVPTPPSVPKYTVTVPTTDITGGTVSGVSGAGQYEEGDTVTITASATAATPSLSDGPIYTFEKWIADGITIPDADAVSSTLNLSFAMPSNDVRNCEIIT